MFCTNCASMLKQWGYLLSVFICSQMMHISGLSITINPPKPISGQTVLLQFSYSGEIFIINWYRGRGTFIKRNILTYSPGSGEPATPGEECTWREKIVDNGMLEISNIMTNYSGEYTLQISTSNGLQTVTEELTVVRHTGYILPVLITIGAVIAIGILVLVVTIWHNKKKKRSFEEPVYEAEPGTERAMEANSSSRETMQPAVRWTPYPILLDHYPSDYQNSNIVYEEVIHINNSVVPNNAENPYTDLTYIQLSSDYQDFRRLNQLTST
ncbi:uncharacterized protein LOC121403020 isoform X3 [Xenopus laevis]|uniref:Uncharacterized protein LOC121403020 isoform X3 n=1 Tax=Xenopus laevis TaxID=8355 RepID=A0A8J1MXC8_XENLA|nr:uncharacterized protein LOC121403020 isoform X3 [Xenopus laevis]